jgi:hypothetical protein
MAFYDQSFKIKFGYDSNRVICKVLSQAQNHFYWPSLTTKIKLTLVTFKLYLSLVNMKEPIQNYKKMKETLYYYIVALHLANTLQRALHTYENIPRLCSSIHI